LAVLAVLVMSPFGVLMLHWKLPCSACLAAEKPAKLAELKQLFWQEAERNRALPLLAAFSVWLGDLPPLPTITRYTYAGDVQNIQTTMIPRIYGRSYAIEANLNVPNGGGEGVLVAFADFIGGFALWVDNKGLLRRRRPRLRGQSALRIHGHGEERRLRPQAEAHNA
jgi:hypothetical protein